MAFDFSFYMPANVFGGENVLCKHKNVFSSLGKRCLIVCGKSSAKKSGALDDLTSILNELNIEYAVFDKITENPLTTDCYEGGRTAAKINADFVVGIGGGSPLDAAKAVCVYATNDDIVDDDIYVKPVASSPLPLVLIGTTAGTGSEVSGVSVLTRKDGCKQSVSGKNFYARYVFADAKYTLTVPFTTTVSTALDALAHAVESMFSPRADYLSRQFSLMSVKLIYPILDKMSITKSLPSNEEREILYYASLYAGFALNKGGTGFPHGMGYALTEDFGVPHGLACAVFLPAFIREAQKADPSLCSTLFSAMGTDFDSLVKLFNEFCKFDFTVTDEQIASYVNRWATLKNFKNSPTDFDNNDAGELLKMLFQK